MDGFWLYRLDSVTVLDIVGADAAKIVHNLVTNEIKSLEIGAGCESFVTDIKGKTLGHVVIFRGDGYLRLIGPAGQSERLVAHIDRYTIVEDATPVIRDHEFVAFVVPPNMEPSTKTQANRLSSCKVEQVGGVAYGVGWLGNRSSVWLIPAEKVGNLDRFHVEPLSKFHQRRVLAGFPWYGIDFSDKNLPQEVNRDAQAISFTKGCYLGQETVARLDAMGQVQKKLVRWELRGSVPGPPVDVQSDAKTVGRLTSIAVTGSDLAQAIGIARRSHFDSGSRAMGYGEDRSQEFTAEVL